MARDAVLIDDRAGSSLRETYDRSNGNCQETNEEKESV
jgi:hypothetical protein